MTKRRLLTAGTVAALAAAVLLFGGVFREEQAAASAGDARAEAIRGYVELERARIAVDPARYPLADRSFREALRIGGADALAYRGLAALAAARHRFDESLRYAQRALRLDPANHTVYGLIGDANIELGNFPAAHRAIDRMVALKPTAAGYARVSYARELIGDTEGAIAAMRLSAGAAGKREPTAWALVHLGNLYAGSGRHGAAQRHYRAALARVRGYAPALIALADVAFRRGELAGAEGLLRRALARVADPGAAAALGDVLAAQGRNPEPYYGRAQALEARFARFGGRNQIETALFDLDHDRNLRDALVRAREGLRLRPGVEGLHTYAWALYKNGRCAAAVPYSDRALALAPTDTGALYHRVLIERCVGNDGAARRYLARVRATDPTFIAPSSYRLRPTIAEWRKQTSSD
jgi:tetratricopeptide (TPR) repeat protein